MSAMPEWVALTPLKVSGRRYAQGETFAASAVVGHELELIGAAERRVDKAPPARGSDRARRGDATEPQQHGDAA